MHTLYFSIELGSTEMLVTGEIDFDFSPEEPRVDRYPDGSGYPGAPAEVDLIEIWITDVTGYDLAARIVYLHHGCDIEDGWRAALIDYLWRWTGDNESIVDEWVAQELEL